MPSLARPCLVLCVSFLVAASPAAGGWVMERTTRTEGEAGPSSEMTLYIAGGRVKETHADGTYFLWDVPRGLLFQVDPASKSYSGGPVTEMIAEVRRYLDKLRERLAKLTDEQREELAARSPGMPMPVPPPKTPPKWSVRETGRRDTIAGRPVRLYEVLKDGVLFEEKWIAPGVMFGEDLDWAQFSKWSRELESSFATGMGGSTPAGDAVERLHEKGVELRSVLVGDDVRVVAEVTRLEERDVPASTFTIPPDYLLRGTQLSSRGGRGPVSAPRPDSGLRRNANFDAGHP